MTWTSQTQPTRSACQSAVTSRMSLIIRSNVRNELWRRELHTRVILYSTHTGSFNNARLISLASVSIGLFQIIRRPSGFLCTCSTRKLAMKNLLWDWSWLKRTSPPPRSALWPSLCSHQGWWRAAERRPCAHKKGIKNKQTGHNAPSGVRFSAVLRTWRAN